jgi:hypothetical protein
MKEIMPIEGIEGKIYLIRGQKVMLDRDLAELYVVPTWRLNEQVKRNRERFPEDFMFSLTRQEIMSISQIAISSSIKFAKNVNAFTEHGILMLSSVLNSERAIQVNITIMRAFVRLRQILSSNKELFKKLEWLEKRYARHEVEIGVVFKLLKKLMEPAAKPTKAIGFVVGKEG